MKLELIVPDDRMHLLGETPEQIILAAQSVLDKELQRLWYVERSKPKPAAPPRPVGRPPISSTERQLREFTHYLDGVYGKLRILYTDAYDAIYKEQEAQYRQMVENKDVVGLALFVKEQPWQKRR